MTPERSPESVFGLLSDETRVDVLRTMAAVQAERGDLDSGPPSLSFTELYDRVDVDNTSKLSYHLGELAGTFLRKDDDGYSFTYAGEQLTRFVLSGNYDRPPEFDPVPADGTCLFCGSASLEASLRDHFFFFVSCTACERPVAGYPITPAQVAAREGRELVRSVGEKHAADYRQIRRGICPTCGGRLETAIRDVEGGAFPDADTFLAIDRCGACRRRYSVPTSYRVAYHPASVAFHWDHGIDVASKGPWEFHEHLAEGRWTSERTAEGSGEFRVVLRRGRDELRAVLDATATVTATERVRQRGAP